jgi:hypothetical protein
MGLSDCRRLLYHWAISPSAPPRNWTQSARMGILHDTTTNSLGDTRIWTMGLSDCSRLLYYWAISPSAPPENCTRITRMGFLHDTTTPAALISETIRFICHKLYARLDKIINLWKTVQGTHGFEPWAYRTAADCSTTELYPPLHHRGIEPRSQEWESCIIPLHQQHWYLKQLDLFVINCMLG